MNAEHDFFAVMDRAALATSGLDDFEKTRGFWFPGCDRVKDMEQFARHAPVLSESEIRFLLGVYLDASPEDAKTARFRKKLSLRQMKKESRK